MNFKIRNFGKIVEADIRLDGITVICGDNNTGKSTVGKALFSLFNSLYDYKGKIALQKSTAISNFIIKNISNPLEMSVRALNPERMIDFVSFHDDEFSFDEVKSYIETTFAIKTNKEKIISLVESLNTPEKDIINESVFRFFNSVMNGQLKNVHSSNSSKCVIIGEFKDSKCSIVLRKNDCSCEMESPIEHTSYYINSPFSLDYLNQDRIAALGMNPMERNVINAIAKAQADINEDSMKNILDSVINKKDLENVRTILKQAYSGDTRIEQGKYFYVENGNLYDFRNISGKKLRELRISAKLSQQDLAEKLQLEGIDLTSKEISKIENNKRLVQDFELFAFAKIFGVSADVFNEQE